MREEQKTEMIKQLKLTILLVNFVGKIIEQCAGTHKKYNLNFIKDNTLFQQNETVLNNNHYVAQLSKLSIIPTSDFLLSTICFWNDTSKVHYFTFGNSLLLVLLNPPFGLAFGHLLTSNLTAELIEICKNETDIDFVLMDINMPVMDGYESTRKIREFNPNLPIIAQTAYSTPEDKEKALAAGCNNFISKPINKDELKSIIDSHLIEDLI